MIRVIGFALYGTLAASTRYRLEQYVPILRMYGIDLKIKYLLNDNYLKSRYASTRVHFWPIIKSYIERLTEISGSHKYDIAIVYGEFLPFFPSFIERALIKIPYIYDFDDAFYLKYHLNDLLRFFLRRKFDSFIKNASAVSAGNNHLTRYASRLNNNVLLLPNAVDIKRYKKITSIKRRKIFTIGWIGSPSNEKYLNLVVKPISKLGSESPVKLVIVGGKAPEIPGVEVQEYPWSEFDEIIMINSFDVGIMPLPSNEWTKGKSAFKLIQYMACGVPVVASSVGANVNLVTDDCGFLASSQREWINALRKLRDNKSLRKKMGNAGRKKIISDHTITNNADALANLIKKSFYKI